MSRIYRVGPNKTYRSLREPLWMESYHSMRVKRGLLIAITVVCIALGVMAAI